MTQASAGLSERARTVLAYEARFLIDKLLRDRIVDTPEEATALFDELKRYLIMVASDKAANWTMYSTRIDLVWHEFILFTEEYIGFCERFFDDYIGHGPGNAPGSATTDPASVASFGDFASRYRELFGRALPDVWYDAKSVTARRRILNDSAGTLALRDNGELVELLNRHGDVLWSADHAARDALAFIAGTGAFYVRELPGHLTDEAIIGIVAALVGSRLLRIGS